MADNLTTQTSALSSVPDATKIATDDAGAAGHVQIVKLAIGTDGSATVIGADANGLDVDVVRLPALVAGTAAIGKLAANSGVDIGDVDVTSISAGTNVIGRTGHDTTGFGSGRKVVTTAGTRVALATTTAAKWVVITAETDNTGIVVVGSAAGVIASLSTREGTPLYATDTMTVLCDDLADIGLDSTVSGDGVTYSYGT